MAPKEKKGFFSKFMPTGTAADNEATQPSGEAIEVETAEVVDDPATASVEEISSSATVPLEDYEKLVADRDQLVDRLARLQAEFENARKREARERTEFRDYAVSKAVTEFLPVVDNFQLALKAGGSAEQLRSGVELIVKQMEEALRTLNVAAVETVGTIFDPRFHEALDSVERDDVPDQQILEEVRRGYRIKERLLRPALVRIASNPQQKEA